MGELLQRVPRVGSAATPALSVAPLFAVQQQQRGAPGNNNNLSSAPSYTPPGSADELTAGVGGGGGSAGATNNVSTAAAVARAAVAELDALFKVVGTPTRADVAAVESLPWRRHLSRLRHRAPTLQRRLGGAAGEVALSLLAHLLAFDPARRASASEALAHEYFQGWSIERDLHPGMFSASASASASAAGASLKAGGAATATAAPPPPSRRQFKHYYDEPDPAAALALLEMEADAACQGYVSSLGCGDTPGGGVSQTESARRSEAGIPALRALLEAECASLAAAAAEARSRRQTEEGGGGGGGSNGFEGASSSVPSRLSNPSSSAAASLPPRPPQPPPRRSTASYLGSGTSLSDLERESGGKGGGKGGGGAGEAPTAEAQAAAASRAFGAHVADAVKVRREGGKERERKRKRREKSKLEKKKTHFSFPFFFFLNYIPKKITGLPGTERVPVPGEARRMDQRPCSPRRKSPWPGVGGEPACGRKGGAGCPEAAGEVKRERKKESVFFFLLFVNQKQ